jgi:hypothetical protein
MSISSQKVAGRFFIYLKFKCSLPPPSCAASLRMSPTCEAYETRTEVIAFEFFFLVLFMFYDELDNRADSCCTFYSFYVRLSIHASKNAKNKLTTIRIRAKNSGPATFQYVSFYVSP